MAKHGKKYEAALAKVDEDKLYTPLEACALAKELASAKFDESIEVAFRLNIDTRQADQQVRGSISLPNGTGKEVRVAVFAEGDKAKEALEAGADVVGSDDLVADMGIAGGAAAVKLDPPKFGHAVHIINSLLRAEDDLINAKPFDFTPYVKF